MDSLRGLPLRIYKFEEQFYCLVKVRLVKGKSTESPTELRHLKLRCVAIGLIIIQVIGLLSSMVKSLQAQDLNLLEITKIGAFLSGLLMCVFRGLTLIVKREKVNRLLRNLESIFPLTRYKQFLHRFPENAQSAHLRNKCFLVMYSVSSLVYPLMAISESLYDWIIRNKEYPYRYPLIALYPFDVSCLGAYPFILGAQTAAFLSAALLVFTDEVIFSTSVSQMCMYYRYLGKLISQIDAREELQSCEKLSQLIRYQYTLESIHNNIDDIFSTGTFIGLVSLRAGISLLLFSMLQRTDLLDLPSFCSSIVVLIIGTYMRCKMGTDLQIASADLLYSIYDHNWYEGSISYRQMIVTMSMRANRPLKIRASKRNVIGMEYFKEIVVQSYTLTAFLYNFSKKGKEFDINP